MQQPVAKTSEQPGDPSAKLSISCPRCAHGNAPDSRFCSACGAPFPVASCPHCGAANPVAADSCHQCHGKLSEGSAAVLDPAAAVAETVTRLSRRPKRLTAGVLAAGAVALATLAFLGYQVYEMLSYVDLRLDNASLPTDVSGGVEEHRGPVDSGPIGREGAASDASAPKVERSAAPSLAPALKPQAAPANAGTTPADLRRASRQPAASRAASGQAPPRAESCTEAIAALGLCTESIPRKE